MPLRCRPTTIWGERRVGSARHLPPKRVTASGRSTYDVTCAFIVKVSHRTEVVAVVPSHPFRTASDAGAPVGPDASAQNLVPSWLPKAKVLAPALPAGYVRHASLLHHIEGLLERRLTVLRAPAGFGKTTVLADVVCGVKAQGLVAGWISLDEDDAPNLFGSCLASAFEHAGLDLALIDVQDAWSSSPAVHQMGMLARAIELHAAPCLLVLDEVDRLPRRTVQLIDLLLTRAPANLHLAMAFRSDPGLDLATHVLAGEAIVVGVRQCRFSTADIARFFHGKLSRRELATVVEVTAGWPVALLVYRNMRAHEAKGLGADAERLTENYVGVRLLHDLSATDRACLLDLAVFDWLDDDLVDEVLGTSDARVRIAAVSSLDGLLVPTNRDRTVRRMHPMLRDYCIGLLSVENPARKRSLHGRIALALARRDDLPSAWRHASTAGDSRLVGELIERFGACALWLREGVIRLIAADRFLTPEIMAGYPRLALLHCIILRLLLKFEEANALYEAVRQRTDGFTRDREGGDADALTVDRIFTQGILASGTDRLAPDEIDALMAVGVVAADGEAPAPFVIRARHHLLCLVCYERANFEACRRYGLQSQARFAEDVRFGTIFVDMCLGMAAMAQGRVQEATDLYTRARHGTRKFFSGDPCLAVGTDVLTIELDLERNHEKRIQPRTLKNLAELRGLWSDVHATAIAVSAELTFGQYGHEAVIQLLTTAVDELRAMDTPRLSDNLSALLAYYLVEVGRADEAGAVWRDHGLPCGVPDLLDLDRQSWRTMESLACARVRLLVEQGDCAAAGEIASRLCDTASAHGLTRTLLRGLALSMVVAERAGQTAGALARLVEFLRRTREVDYVRPLVRHREVSRTVLHRLLGTDLDTDVRRAAESMLVHVGEPATATAPIFSARERDVLAVLVEVGEDIRNTAIASRLGITEEGLRYHLRNIYRKTGSSKRADAVRYAQSLGLS